MLFRMALRRAECCMIVCILWLSFNQSVAASRFLECLPEDDKVVVGQQIWCAKNSGSNQCFWEYTDHGRFYINPPTMPRFTSYALLSSQIELDTNKEISHKICLRFFSNVSHFDNKSGHLSVHMLVNSENIIRKAIDVTGHMSICDDTRERSSTIMFVLNVSCSNLTPYSYVNDLNITTEILTTFPTNTPSSPTPIGDIQYVGVVVGAICIALFTLFSCLTIISARRSSARESRRREIQTASCNEQDDRPDVVAENAPPSYDAVMACPDLYPTTPLGSPAGTPAGTPHLSLHRRVLLNQAGGSLQGSPQSQRRSISPATSEAWDEYQEPPPPYPGLARRPSADTTPPGARTPPPSGARTPSDSAPPDDRPATVSAPGREADGPWVLNASRTRVSSLRRAPESGGEEIALTETAAGSSSSSLHTSSSLGDDAARERVNNARNTREAPAHKVGPRTPPGPIPQLTVV